MDYGTEAVTLSATNVHVLDSCISTALYRIFGVGNQETVWQLKQFLGLYGMRIMVKHRKQRFINGLTDSGRYGVLMKVIGLTFCTYAVAVFDSLASCCVLFVSLYMLHVFTFPISLTYFAALNAK